MTYDSLFRSFPPFEWRTGDRDAVQFPVTSMSIDMQQDLAEHAFWGRDGERYEATGRKSLVIQASIPFRNGIVPGPTENWGILYPDGWTAFLAATANRKTGVLSHPQLGKIKCKVRHTSTKLDANRRDGVDVDVTWVETLEPDDLGTLTPNSMSEVRIGAITLNNEISTAEIKGELTRKGLLNQRTRTSLFDLANSVAAIGDQAALGQLRAVGKIEKALYSVQKISDSFSNVSRMSTQSVDRSTLRVRQLGDRAKTVRDLIFNPTPAAVAETVLAWPVRQQATKLENALIDLKKTLLAEQKTIVFYRVPADTTLAGIVPATGAKVKDLLRLNPGIANRPVVKADTIVRYYAA